MRVNDVLELGLGVIIVGFFLDGDMSIVEIPGAAVRKSGKIDPASASYVCSRQARFVAFYRSTTWLFLTFAAPDCIPEIMFGVDGSFL